MKTILEPGLIAGAETRQKELGAYYTAADVASFLVAWAVRSPNDIVIDPSFGGGVFLRAACRRIVALGGIPATQVRGVEIDGDTYRHTRAALDEEFGISDSALQHKDFFELEPGSEPADAVVGNPPFIRYHRFNGEARKLALRRAKSEGVTLSELASSWAPFLVHAISMVRPGGRLAMVTPFEIAHAGYARPVLDLLARTFAKVTFLTFHERVFADLSEDTILVLAEGAGRGRGRFGLRDLSSVADLFKPSSLYTDGRGTRPLDAGALCEGRERLVEYLLPADVRRLYEELKQSDRFHRLGDLANVGIGYVTGANNFFHLSPSDVARWNIPPNLLKPALRRGRVLNGVRFTEADWLNGLPSKETGYLLHIGRSARVPEAVQEYIRHGGRSGVSGKFKCRTRSPWYHVPNVYVPDAFLTYMSGVAPKLVANAAGAVAPNSLHIVRLRDNCKMNAEQLSALWHNSLTLLSTEIEGHALGGGMLKMEPVEARSILLPAAETRTLSALADELDDLCRRDGQDAACELGNERILRWLLGLSAQDCALLQAGRDILLSRRYHDGKTSCWWRTARIRQAM